MTFNYVEDARLASRGDIRDPALRFSPPPEKNAHSEQGAARHADAS
jgi:hypothetical protein